jgi:flagellar hook-length control protein FliK
VQTQNGTLVPQPLVVVSGGKATQGAEVAPGLMDENVQPLPADPDLVTALPEAAAVATPHGNTTDGAPPARAEALALPKNTGGGIHTKGHRPPADLPVPVVLGQMSQPVPDAVLTIVVPAPLPMAVPPMALPASAPAVTLGVGTGGDEKPAAPHRPMSVDPAKVQTDSVAGQAAGEAPLRTEPLTADEPAKIVVDAARETPALSLRADVPQVSLSVTASSPPLKADHPQPAAPADQIAPALVGILQKPDGQQSVTIRLQPVELGQVQIRVDQTVGGVAHINITAERPETLQILQRDEPRLQQVLDQAGVQSTGRTVSFQVASPEQVGAPASRPDSMETGAGASGQGQNGGAWRQNGDSPNDFEDGTAPGQGENRPRWFRAGLDITA